MFASRYKYQSSENKNPKRVVHISEIEIQHIDKEKNIVSAKFFDHVINEEVERLGILLNAIGYVPKNITKPLVPRQQVISLPENTEYWKNENYEFISTRDTPVGSLLDDSLRFLKIDGNLYPDNDEIDFGFRGEFQAFHLDRKTGKLPMPYKKIYEECKIKKIPLSENFLKQVIKDVKTSKTQKSAKDFIEHLTLIYEMIEENPEVEKFKEVLYSINKEIPKSS